MSKTERVFDSSHNTPEMAANRPLILFVSHQQRHCGVYEFGREIVDQLAHSQRYDFKFVECSGLRDFVQHVNQFDPVGIVFQWHPVAVPWAADAAAFCSDIPVIATTHDLTRSIADSWRDNSVDVLVAHEPELGTSNQRFVTAPRPIPEFVGSIELPQSPIRIGSFGFADHSKNFHEIVEMAQDSFEECVIRIQMPYSDFDTRAKAVSQEVIERCRAQVRRPGVSMEFFHHFLNREQLFGFLASNHLNVLLYDPDRGGGGISSASDFLLASGRPMALRRGRMFRNFDNAKPSIFVDDLPLHKILENGTTPLEPFRAAWTYRGVVDAYERAVDRLLCSSSSKTPDPQ